ncbi:MAG TPA: YceI family protein [Xanthomonadales bacterium]|nr:YceI family protein [Xanthomonadales bacterium]
MIRALPVLLLLPLAASARDYAVDAGASTLTFKGSAQGEAFDGKFSRFTATVAVDAADATKTAIAAEIDVASVDTQNAERDETLAGAEFFDFAKFPKATFRTKSCKAAGAGKFTCDAELTIRDKSQAIAFPFTFAEGPGKATLDATVALDRTKFDVGTGDWSGEDAVAHAVTVNVHLVLAPK